MKFSKRNHKKLLTVVFFTEDIVEKDREIKIESLTALAMALTFSGHFTFICINKCCCIAYVSHEKIIKIGDSQISNPGMHNT